MQGKGLVRFFLVFLIVVCVYQFALIIPTRIIEKKASAYAENICLNAANDEEKQYCLSRSAARYLDSLSDETVLNLGFTKFNYQELKQQQLALGLDLKGGMSVVLQIDLKDLVIELAENSSNPNFRKALEVATKRQSSSQSDFISLFKEAFEQIAPKERLAPIFQANPALQDQITFESTNDEVAEILREQANQTVDLTFTRLKQRIDKFGVTQPNISLDNVTDRIIVELPGIDNPERARKFLQATAKLEFWDVYRIDELQNQLAQGNEKLKVRLSKSGSLEEVEKVDTTAQTTDTTALDSTKTATTDSAKVTPTPVAKPDSATAKADSNALKNNEIGPLFKVFTPNFAGPQGISFSPAVIGIAKASDTAKVSRYLRMQELALPRNAILCWSSKPMDDEENRDKFLLYALKVPSDGVAPLQGDMISDARQDLDPQTNNYIVSISMKEEGARIWSKMTQAAAPTKREIAIVLDNEVVSAPAVQNAIRDGRSQITGSFTAEEAVDLANILQVGKLPAKTQIIEESVVGPSLGKENIRASIISLVVGLLIVMVFMAFYYAQGGILSVVLLVANIVFIFGTLASLNAVLTLPGIAGIVLTIGMAVDANVIIYERIREELLEGKALLQAIKDGFTNSYSSILDANITTLLTAIVLFYFGLGPIKGFATVLIIGILSSLFTAILVTQLLIEWWLSKERPLKFSIPMTEGALKNLTIDFVKLRKISYIASGSIIFIGLVSFFLRGFELGVDFKGGYSYAIKFEKPVTSNQIKQEMTKVFGEEPVVKAFGSANTYEITTTYLIESEDPNADRKVLEKLHEGAIAIVGEASAKSIEEFTGESRDGVAPTHITRSIKVGPAIADDITKSAFVAGLLALLGIFGYIAIRFRKWQYSAGAVIALFHDVMIVLAMFSLFHGILPFSLQIDQAFIAAILTVIGYSVNDTVIVYDRIREYFAKIANKTNAEIVNFAVNDTISRTTLTSLTTLCVVLILFLFGGSSIKGFSFALLVGIVVGTYSSIFIATPIVYDLAKDLSMDKPVKTAGKKRPTSRA